ncbi:hypothetical protein PWT90_05887 [Aphanocladium album]|nr:hypothetical protein PWT90_05887 [Aphanocladium album]
MLRFQTISTLRQHGSSSAMLSSPATSIAPVRQLHTNLAYANQLSASSDQAAKPQDQDKTGAKAKTKHKSTQKLPGDSTFHKAPFNLLDAAKQNLKHTRETPKSETDNPEERAGEISKRVALLRSRSSNTQRAKQEMDDQPGQVGNYCSRLLQAKAPLPFGDDLAANSTGWRAKNHFFR